MTKIKSFLGDVFGGIVFVVMSALMEISEALIEEECSMCGKPVKTGYVYCKSCVDKMRRKGHVLH